MANILSAEDLADLVSGTLDDLGRMRIQQIAQDIQAYTVYDMWLRSEADLMRGGTGVQKNLMLELGELPEYHGVYHKKNYEVGEYVAQMNVKWKHISTHWAYSYYEQLMQANAEHLVFEVIMPRRINAFLTLFKRLENGFWQDPDASQDSVPWGVKYWITSNSSDGFNGGNPSGFSSKAGIDCDTYPNFKNYTFTYENFTADDLFQKLREFRRKADWQTPIPNRERDYGQGTPRTMNRYTWCTNNEVLTYIEKQLELRNENLGNDVTWGFDGARIGPATLKYVPKLDADTTNPVVGIDKHTFRPRVLRGDYFREDGPIKLPEQPDTYVTNVSLTHLYECFDPRRSCWGYQTS